MRKEHVITIIVSLLILLFSYTAFSKLLDLSFFRAQMELFPVLDYFPGTAAIGIPVTELFIVALLLYPPTMRMGLKASSMLLLLFTLYLLLMIMTVPDLPCSCGGVISTMSWSQHILFNLFCIALSVAALWFTRKQKDQGPAG